MIELRPYQTDAQDAFLRFVEDGNQRGMIVLPTGCGKTITGLDLARRMNARTLWIAHREELITQPIKALRNVWPKKMAGVVKADRNEWARDFVFASVQTAWRPGRIERLTGFDLVVVDEAHHAAAESYKKILKGAGCFDDGGPPLVGFTATPERSDMLRLDDVFNGVAYHYPLVTAIEAGYLVRPEMESRPIGIDLGKIGKARGDFKSGELDAALLESGIVENVCGVVDDIAKHRKTIIFTVSVKQAEGIAEELRSRGYAASSVSGETPITLRRRRLDQFAKGEITHMVNCMVLTEGFDDPGVDCIIMARPTLSKSLYVQCVGRGLRIAPGKESCLIIDMVGLSSRHTLIQAPVIFGVEGTLDDTRESAGSYEDSGPCAERNEKLLMGQIRGVEATARSPMRWVPTSKGSWALGCGQGGTLLMEQSDDGWTTSVVGRPGASGREVLIVDVDLESAQGAAEDYVRRAGAVYLSDRSMKWRSMSPTDAQLSAMKAKKIDVPNLVTRGEASDLLTANEASHWRNDFATEKQKTALARKGIEFDEQTITKGGAGRLLSRCAR